MYNVPLRHVQVSTDVSVGYNPDFVKSDDYLLFVHGFNLNSTDKEYWPGTVFKRLWWQRYKGSFGFFDWPCAMFEYLDPTCYDNCEFNAWRCGAALLHRVNMLNDGGHFGKVRVLAHSQGNVVMGEALRQASGQVVHTYIASQAAIAGDCYQTGLDCFLAETNTPNVFVNYPTTGSPYLSGVLAHAANIYSYYNVQDYALAGGFQGWIGSWRWNNENRPDHDYYYADGDNDFDTFDTAAGDRFYYDDGIFSPAETLNFTNQTYRIFSYAAQARSSSLGVLAAPNGFTAFNLCSSPLNYDEQHYSHSRQFRSNIVKEWAYWDKLITNCGF